MRCSRGDRASSRLRRWNWNRQQAETRLSTGGPCQTVIPPSSCSTAVYSCTLAVRRVSIQQQQHKSTILSVIMAITASSASWWASAPRRLLPLQPLLLRQPPWRRRSSP